MKKINMGKYSPYKKLGKTITREIKDKIVIWPYYEQTWKSGEISIRILEKKDVDEVAELWRMCYGELYGSSLKYEWVLYSERYETYVAFKENWKENSQHKNFCMIVYEDTVNHRIFGAWALWKENKNLQIEFSLGVVHPENRKGESGVKMVSIANDIIKVLEKESGAEYLSAFCETWQNIAQFLCFKQWGFKVAGIFPGQFTRWNGGQSEYRACEVHFYKFLGDTEKYVTKPEEWELLPEFKKLWNVLEEINKSSTEKIY